MIWLVKMDKNNKFEKKWAKFLENVENPEIYMTGKIKEACREFHKINTDYKGGWEKWVDIQILEVQS